MLDMIDVVTTTDSVATDFTPEAMDSQNELGEAISNLWVAHANAKIAARTTNEELHAIRAKLGEQLCEMKQILAKPGRDGQWSGFLREHNIPRATADRLVIRYLRSVNPDANRLSEPVSEPTEEEVQRLFSSILPRLRRLLRTPNSVYSFVSMLTSSYGTCRRVTDEGILVLKVAQQEPSAGQPGVEAHALLTPIVGLDPDLM